MLIRNIPSYKAFQFSVLQLSLMWDTKHVSSTAEKKIWVGTCGGKSKYPDNGCSLPHSCFPTGVVCPAASPLPDKASNDGASALMMRPGATFVTSEEGFQIIQKRTWFESKSHYITTIMLNRFLDVVYPHLWISMDAYGRMAMGQGLRPRDLHVLLLYLMASASTHRTFPCYPIAGSARNKLQGILLGLRETTILTLNFQKHWTCTCLTSQSLLASVRSVPFVILQCLSEISSKIRAGFPNKHGRLCTSFQTHESCVPWETLRKVFTVHPVGIGTVGAARRAICICLIFVCTTSIHAKQFTLIAVD